MFKLDNFYIFYDEPSTFQEKIPQVDKIQTAELSTIKLLGICKNDSYYEIAPQDVITTSLGNELTISYKLTGEINVASRLTDSELSNLNNKYCSIVLVPKTVNIPNDALSLADTGITKLDNAELIYLAPSFLKIKINVKIGNREINPINISFTQYDSTIENLIKKYIVDLTPGG